MDHKPVIINDISFVLDHKACFEHFSTTIYPGDKIACIGRNGSGKSILLKIILGQMQPTSGQIIVPTNVTFGYVAQESTVYDALSGGQRFQKNLTNALCERPNILILDEPTNHLDQQNRASLMRMLHFFKGTLIIVTHDTELLRTCCNIIWHIDDGHVTTYRGSYDNYKAHTVSHRSSIEKELVRIHHQKEQMHDKKMQEQERAAKSKSLGEKKVATKRWTKTQGDLKGMKAQKSQAKKLQTIENQKQHLTDELSRLRLPEIIIPTFSLSSADIPEKTIISVCQGDVGYTENDLIVRNIRFSVNSHERVALLGKNGSGKSTFVKALLRKEGIVYHGEWNLPSLDQIGYLDQHYKNLDPHATPLDSLAQQVPDWSPLELRKHLNEFLFRKNEEVTAPISQLSGGEKARLSLAHIGAKTPALLILDEITNNLDLETRNHIRDVLISYPGAFIIICHENDFLEEINIQKRYLISEGTITVSV